MDDVFEVRSQVSRGGHKHVLKRTVLEVCPKDLAVHLKEREIASLEDLANAADRYLTAHQRKFCTVSNAPTSQPTTISDGTNTASIGERA